MNMEQRLIDKGVAKGKAEGAEDEKKQIAKNMLDLGINLNIICKATGLSMKQLKDLMH